MNRLRDVISQYGRWNTLSTYIDRIETYIVTDFNISIENAKSLIETISKEICSQKDVDISSRDNFQNVIKKAFYAIGYQSDSPMTQITKSLGNIGQQIGTLRNTTGITSHGKTLQELSDSEKKNQEQDTISKDFLIETVIIISIFLIHSFENENPRAISSDEGIRYEDNEEFNTIWDETFGEFNMGNYAYRASEILYSLDLQAYKTETIDFTDE